MFVVDLPSVDGRRRQARRRGFRTKDDAIKAMGNLLGNVQTGRYV
jgi:hypothetical protein